MTASGTRPDEILLPFLSTRPGAPAGLRPRGLFVRAGQLLAMPRVERSFLRRALCSAPAHVDALEQRLAWIAAEAARGSCPVSVSRMRWELLAGSSYDRLAALSARLRVPDPVRADETGRWTASIVERRLRAGDVVVVVADFFAPCVAPLLERFGHVALLCPVAETNEFGTLSGMVTRPVVGAGLQAAVNREITRLGLDGRSLTLRNPSYEELRRSGA